MISRFGLTRFKPRTRGALALVLLFSLLIQSREIRALTVAEMAYNANPWNETCAQPDPNRRPSFDKSILCLKPNGTADRIRKLQTDFGEISEEAYLASLADERSKALKCSEDEITSLLGDSRKLSAFKEDVSKKLVLLSHLNAKIASLQGSVGANKDSNEEYKKAKLARDAVNAALPYTDLPSMQLLYNHISSQSDLFKNGDDSVTFQKYFQGSLADALQRTSQKLKTDRLELENGIENPSGYSSSIRKSLAQDKVLVERLREENKNFEGSMKPIACRVDAKYGTGAIYVHETYIFAGSLAVGGPAAGGLKIANTAIMGAVASGELSSGAASILRLGAIGMASGAGGSVALYDSCLKAHPLAGGGKSCSGVGVRALPQANCFLSLVLTSTAAVASIPGAQSALKYFEAKAALNSADVKSAEVAAAKSATQIESAKSVTLASEAKPVRVLTEREIKAAQQKQRLTTLAKEQEAINPAGKVDSSTASIKVGTTLTHEPVLNYDVVMAKKANLSLSEVVALRKNFAEAIPETGETGVFRIGENLAMDGESNLVNAYANFSKKLASGNPLTAKDLIEVRSQAYEFRSVTNKKGTEIVSIPTAFKGKFSTTLETEISPYVQDRLKHYNIEFKIADGKTKIMYPEGSRESALEGLASEINQMIAKGDPPERIASFATQDLLILHPFKDGNGRTARVVGQALLKNLKNEEVVFPQEFHREMEYSVDDLARKIMPPPPKNPRTLEEVSQKAYFENPKVLPEMVSPSKVKSKAPRGDVPFPKQFTNLEGKKVDYASYPEEFRKISGEVYYGKRGGDTLQEAEKKAIDLMKYGRGSRDPNPHLELREHINGTQFESGKQSSGFFSTSQSFEVAEAFSHYWREYRVVFAIDPKGAEILNLPKLKAGGAVDTEKEILFGSRLNPQRVKAAIIYDKTGNIVKILKNPEYVPEK
jgi:hypothetical protein